MSDNLWRCPKNRQTLIIAAYPTERSWATLGDVLDGGKTAAVAAAGPKMRVLVGEDLIL